MIQLVPVSFGQTPVNTLGHSVDTCRLLFVAPQFNWIFFLVLTLSTTKRYKMDPGKQGEIKGYPIYYIYIGEVVKLDVWVGSHRTFRSPCQTTGELSLCPLFAQSNIIGPPICLYLNSF